MHFIYQDSKDHVDFENYRHVVHKWHFKIAKALVVCLESKDYVQIRNALIILTKILPHFPVIVKLNGVIEKRIEKVCEEEKDSRKDLYIKAMSYSGQLKVINYLINYYAFISDGIKGQYLKHPSIMGCFPTEPVVVVLGSGTKNVRFSRIFWEVGSLNTSLMIGSGSKKFGLPSGFRVLRFRYPSLIGTTFQIFMMILQARKHLVMREHEFHQINGPKQDEMKEDNENPPTKKSSTKKETITIKDDSKSPSRSSKSREKSTPPRHRDTKSKDRDRDRESKSRDRSIKVSESCLFISHKQKNLRFASLYLLNLLLHF